MEPAEKRINLFYCIYSIIDSSPLISKSPFWRVRKIVAPRSIIEEIYGIFYSHIRASMAAAIKLCA
jgi:hypothetical protein